MVVRPVVIPTEFDPRKVCEALGLEPQIVRTVITEPHQARVELLVFDDEGRHVIQGDDVVTVWVTLERSP